MSRNQSLALSIASIAAVATSFALAAGGGRGGALGGEAQTSTSSAPGTATAAAEQARGGRGGRGRRGAQTPPPASEGVVLPESVPADGRPQINGPRITGATPGRPFMFHVPVTGDNVTISIDGLPDGLSVDSKTGLITGSLKAPLVTAVTIHAKNPKGEASRQFVIVGGTHKLALTPPLGWNSWNCYGGSVSQTLMERAADAMVKSGLAAHGFEYVNLDDGWAPRPGPAARNAEGVILPNEKFPDMKALGDYIHAKGLKFGTYSGPGTATCQRLEASFNHEEIDAKTWASWGVDYIKYDLCAYDTVAANLMREANTNERTPEGIAIHKLPYQKLRPALDKLDRDVVYSICQYNRTLQVHIWGWEEGVNGNLWRVTGDISTGPNVWTSMSGIGFQQNGHEVGAGPGHWNDTDMLVVGAVGLANGGTPRPTYLTENEQLTHIGLWSLLAAPLLLGCDMSLLDPAREIPDKFTHNLMCNDEMLAIDQDPLGKQAWRIAAMSADDQPIAGGGRGSNNAAKQIWARPLWDGTYAVGLFNLDTNPQKISISLKDLSAGLKLETPLSGPVPVRDVWQLKDLAPATDTISAEVPRHGMAFLRLGKPKPEAECIDALVFLHRAR
jgi:alpha-galactosidase